MWQGTLVYSPDTGSIAELIDAGVSILSVIKVKTAKHRNCVAVRFNNESMQKLKELKTTYIWTGRWVERKTKTS